MKIFRVLLLILPLFVSCTPTRIESKAHSHITKLAIPAPTIVIDAGHGGLDLGTRCHSPYCEEKRVALITAQLARRYLDKLGYKVILTRNTDAFIPLKKRVQATNCSRAELFVSIHYNASPNKGAHGIEIFYSDAKKDARSQESRRLAGTILKDVLQRTKARDRGVKRGNFYVIRESKIPAVLLEGGFITNQDERFKLKDQKYLDKIARGIAEGIDEYFRMHS